MPVLNILKKILQTYEKKSNNKMINSTRINNKIKNVKTHSIYIFMDDIEIKKLFDDHSINTTNNIKIEKKGTIINFDIKKITRINNSVIASRINNSVTASKINNDNINNNDNTNTNNKKIENIKKKLRGINDNIIIYIKPLKSKSNIINKNKVDYIFLKKINNNSENKLKSRKRLKSLLRMKTNSDNDQKNTNFENNLKNKIKYFKSDDIFLEIVNIINSLSSSNNNKTNNESINNKNNTCNVNNKIGYKLENKSGYNKTFTNNIGKNYYNTFDKMCNETCQKDKWILVKSFREKKDLKDIEGKLNSFLNKNTSLFSMLPLLISFNIYKRNSKIRTIKDGKYIFDYENENPIISINKNNKNMYRLLYKEINNIKYFELIEKKLKSTITYKVNFSDILYFIMINLVTAEITIILKRCANVERKSKP